MKTCVCVCVGSGEYLSNQGGKLKEEGQRETQDIHYPHMRIETKKKEKEEGHLLPRTPHENPIDIYTHSLTHS